MDKTLLIGAWLTALSLTTPARAELTQTPPIQIFDTTPLADGPYYVNDHTLIQGEDGRWHLYGIFHHEPFGSDQELDFVHAVSHEPRPGVWGPQSFASEGIALHADRSIGESHIWAPHVMRVADHQYAMIYHGGWTAPDNDHASMRLALSSDLDHWQRVGAQPLFEDICVARDPMLLRQGADWIVYYTRCNSTQTQRSGVAYRISRDLRHWSEPRMALVLQDSDPMFNSGFTESPFVFERDGWYYLSVTSYPIDWTATMVYRSRDPLHFPSTPYARLEAHAAEWIIEPGPLGRVWLSHCGAGQRGVWLSEIRGF